MGSEMCIRDSRWRPALLRDGAPAAPNYAGRPSITAGAVPCAGTRAYLPAVWRSRRTRKNAPSAVQASEYSHIAPVKSGEFGLKK